MQTGVTIEAKKDGPEKGLRSPRWARKNRNPKGYLNGHSAKNKERKNIS